MKSLKLFWWSPTRSARLAWPEVRGGGLTWLRVARAGGVPGQNFGDELSPLMVAHATGRRVRWAPPGRADLVAIGSVLELQLAASSTCMVWGTGLRAPWPASARRPDSGRFLAVRGPMTRNELGLSSTACPVGDPGLLVPRLLVGGTLARHGTTLLPHFRVWASRKGRKQIEAVRAHGVSTLSPANRPLEVADALRRSDLVLTSSLHGLITCHALGIPVIRASFGNAVDEDAEFKYQDHAMSMNLTVPRLDIADFLRSGVPQEARERARAIAEISPAGCEQLATLLLQALSQVNGA